MFWLESTSALLLTCHESLGIGGCLRDISRISWDRRYLMLTWTQTKTSLAWNCEHKLYHKQTKHNPRCVLRICRQAMRSPKPVECIDVICGWSPRCARSIPWSLHGSTLPGRARGRCWTGGGTLPLARSPCPVRRWGSRDSIKYTLESSRKCSQKLSQKLSRKSSQNLILKINEIKSWYMSPFQIWVRVDFREDFR